MSYKYSKGSTVQGDIKAADDTNRDTMIDFGEDRIDLQTHGSTRFKISGSNGEITFNEAYKFPTADGNADQVIELHGNIFNAYCLNCGQTFETENFFNLNVKTTGDSICPSCKNGYVKVGTISFGQKLKTSVINSAKIASENCDYFIVMGSSLKVSPANSMLRIAKNNGAEVIILNKDPTPFDSEASIIINGDLEKIYDEIR